MLISVLRSTPQRLKAMIWVLCHGKLMTNMERWRGGMIQDPYCKFSKVRWRQGSNNRSSPIRLGRFITDSGLIKSISLPGTRRRVYRLKIGKTRWTRSSLRDDSVNSVQNGENTENNLNKQPKKQRNLKNKQ